MNIILTCDFSNKEFNKDFMLSNALIARDHTVLLVTNENQLNDSIYSYDLVIAGFSNKIDLTRYNKPQINMSGRDFNTDSLIKLIEDKKNDLQ